VTARASEDSRPVEALACPRKVAPADWALSDLVRANGPVVIARCYRLATTRAGIGRPRHTEQLISIRDGVKVDGMTESDDGATCKPGRAAVLACVEWHPPDFQNRAEHRGVTPYEATSAPVPSPAPEPSPDSPPSGFAFGIDVSHDQPSRPFNIATISLDSIAGLHRHERRRDHLALHTQLRQLPVQGVARLARFLANP